MQMGDGHHAPPSSTSNVIAPGIFHIWRGVQKNNALSSNWEVNSFKKSVFSTGDPWLNLYLSTVITFYTQHVPFVVITFVHFTLFPLNDILLPQITGIIQNGKIWSIFIHEMMVYTYNLNVYHYKQVKINTYITNNRMHFITQLYYVKMLLQTNNEYIFPMYIDNISLYYYKHTL
jgi:hypothetical protein